MKPSILLLLAPAIAGCAQTNYPQMLPASLVNQTDDLAQRYIKALAGKNRQQLIDLGRSPVEAEKDIADSPHLTDPAKPRYLLDMILADSYARQYAVALFDGGEVEIRVWFSNSKSNGPEIKDYQALPRVQQ